MEEKKEVKLLKEVNDYIDEIKVIAQENILIVQ